MFYSLPYVGCVVGRTGRRPRGNSNKLGKLFKRQFFLFYFLTQECQWNPSPSKGCRPRQSPQLFVHTIGNEQFLLLLYKQKLRNTNFVHMWSRSMLVPELMYIFHITRNVSTKSCEVEAQTTPQTLITNSVRLSHSAHVFFLFYLFWGFLQKKKDVKSLEI